MRDISAEMRLAGGRAAERRGAMLVLRYDYVGALGGQKGNELLCKSQDLR